MPGIVLPDERELPPGPRRNLVLALFQLYERAGKPPVREVSKRIRQRDDLPSTASHETVSAVLRGKGGPPRWPTLESLVVVLVQQSIRPVDPSREKERIHQLWLALDQQADAGDAAAEQGDTVASDKQNDQARAGGRQVTSNMPVLLLVTNDRDRSALLEVARGQYGLEPRLTSVQPSLITQLGRLGSADLVVGRGVGGQQAALAALSVDALLHQVRPAFVILVGACFGLRPTAQRVGDLILATQVWDVSHYALVDLGNSDVREPRAIQYHPSRTLLNIFMGATETWEGQAVHSAPLLGSPVLYKSSRATSALVEEFPRAAGGDMDSHIVGAVAAERGIDWLVVRGIADMGDGARLAEHGDLGSSNVARYVLHVLASGLLGGAASVRSPSADVR